MTKRGCIKIFEGRVYARVRFGNDERIEPRLPWAKASDTEKAEERSAIIGELCDLLIAAGRRDLIRETAKHAAAATPAKLETVRKAVVAIAKGAAPKVARSMSFYDLAEAWIRGDLLRDHPDHVRAKTDFHIEEGRLRRYIYPHVKDVPVTAFERGHADLVMSKLPPKRVKSAGTRRHVAQIMSTLLNYAVMPLGLIKQSPLPRGYLPRISEHRHYTCLFPREEATFLACKEIDEAFRLFIGLLDREGMRVSELADCEWWQFNTVEGTFTATKTKTGDPRMWALRPDSARAMRLWEKRFAKKKSRPFIDVVPDEDAKLTLASRLRDALALAGVTRTELFESTAYTGKLRAHDMRATFVTVSLAEGKTETWIRDRTAHKTLSMIDRYRRTARQFEELKLGPLVDLVDAMGWGISRVILATGTGGDGGDSEEESNGSDVWIRTIIRGSKSRLGPGFDPPNAVIAGSLDTEDDAPIRGIPRGSPTLIGLAGGLALERARWDALDEFVASELAVEVQP